MADALANPTFSRQVSLTPLQRKTILEIRPMEGKLGPNEKQVFKMKVTPGIPDRISEKFHVQVAHFEPEEIFIVGEGIYPCVAFNIPHVYDLEDTYEAFLEQAHSRLVARGPVKGGPVPLPAMKTARTVTAQVFLFSLSEHENPLL